MRRQLSVLSIVIAAVACLAALPRIAQARQVAIVVMTGSGQVSFIDVDRARVMRTVQLDGKASFPKRVAVTPDGSTAIVTCDTGYISFLDVVQMRSIKTLELLAGPEQLGQTFLLNEFDGVAVTPDGGTALVTERNEVGQLFLVDLAAMDVLEAPVFVGDEPSTVIVKSDGSEIYVLDDGSFHILRLDGSFVDFIFQPAGTDEVGDFALTPDESRAILVDADDHITLLDTTTAGWDLLDQETVAAGRFAEPSSVAISPAGTLAVVGNATDQRSTTTIAETMKGTSQNRLTFQLQNQPGTRYR